LVRYSFLRSDLGVLYEVRDTKLPRLSHVTGVFDNEQEEPQTGREIIRRTSRNQRKPV